MQKLLVIICSIAMASATSAQVRLENGSFEGPAQDATTPVNWHPCALGTTPDILPGPWGVHKEASDGETFLGLITREDGTYESIGQRLSDPLRNGECYSLKMDLSYSKNYASYNNAIQLRVWGSTTRCSKDQLLFVSEVIDHTDWESYEFKFSTEVAINYIILEAYNPKAKNGQYLKGNINIDGFSAIKVCGRASL